MHTKTRDHHAGWVYHFLLAALLAAASVGACADATPLNLSGAHEVPAVHSDASGSGQLVVKDDRSVSGMVTTTGMVGTAAHIHLGAAGKNGAVAISLQRQSETEWMVPLGAKLDKAQMQAYKAGRLYVNVHSEAHPDGEIRDQLQP